MTGPATTRPDLPPRAAELLADCATVYTTPMAWGEMDAFQHLNNVAYFRYFESARIAYFEWTGITAGGIPQRIGPILASTGCRYKAPLTYPDTLHVGVRLAETADDRFTLEYRVVSQALGLVAAVGDSVIVSYDYETNRKVPLPDAWREAFAAIGGGS